MSISAFGIDHGGIAKAHEKNPTPASGGRYATGILFPGMHGAVAGKKKHKLKAVGYEVGGSMLGGPIGAGVGVHFAQKEGHYKSQTSAEDGVKKSAFGTPGDKRNTKYAMAAYGGAAVGGQVGTRVGAKSAGVGYRQAQRASRQAGQQAVRLKMYQAAAEGHAMGPKEGFQAAKEGMRSVKGGAEMYRGGNIGGAVGAGAGVAAYAIHRHNQKKQGN